MKITPEQYERINRFLDAEMTAEEMLLFKQELEQYSEVRAQLDFEQQVREGLVTEEKFYSPQFVGEQLRTDTPKLGQSPVKKLLWLAVAAACALLVLLLFPVWKSTKPEETIVVRHNTAQVIKKKDTLIANKLPPDDTGSRKNLNTDSLFKVYFEKDEIPDEYPPYLTEALTKYQQNNFTTLLELDLTTRGVNEQQEIEELGYYYKGIANIQRGSIEKALIHLNKSKSAGINTNFKNATDWYIALAHLKKGDVKNAIITLQKSHFKKETDKFHKQAQSLLNILIHKESS